MPRPANPTSIESASYLLMIVSLFVVLHQGLVAALFHGLLVYSLIHLISPLIEKRISGPKARLVAVALIAIVVIGSLSLAIWGAIVFFKSDAGSVRSLLQRLADIVEASRNQSPAWLRDRLPTGADDLSNII